MSSAADQMRARVDPLRLVVFDCDGVIVDSEGVSNRVLAEEITAFGWHMTAEHAEHMFIGNNIDAIEARITDTMGRAPDATWRERVKRRIIEALARDSQPIPGAIEALDALDAAGLPWRVASNSSHAEMAVKFRRLGIAARVAGRVHSFEDVARPKPAPDVYLAAAEAEGVLPSHCVVIEDSVPGTLAAVAAGMECLGFDRSADGAFLRAAGAHPFHDMRDLPAILALAPRREAA